jgi:predicted phosphodiesterase
VFHGSPRSNVEDLLASTPAHVVDEMLGGRIGAVMAGGHTHIQMLRQHHGCLLINPGSVGMPFKDYVEGKSPTILSHAEYAIVQEAGSNVEVSLRRISLDRDKLRAAQQHSDHPLREYLLRQYS